MALTEADFDLFRETAAAPQIKPKREPIHTMRQPRGDSMELKNLKAHKAWMQSLVAFVVTGLVGLCLFLVVQAGAQHHTALVENQQLTEQLKVAQQNNISYKSQLERKFSLEIIQNTALRQYHMVPVEGGLVKYLNITHGDQRLD
jgi:cytoskeletal protein RodZ